MGHIAPMLTLGGVALLATDPAMAADLLREEPANALSLPTWAIHVSSVVEWVAAMVRVLCSLNNHCKTRLCRASFGGMGT